MRTVIAEIGAEPSSREATSSKSSDVKGMGFGWASKVKTRVMTVGLRDP